MAKPASKSKKRVPIAKSQKRISHSVKPSHRFSPALAETPQQRARRAARVIAIFKSLYPDAWCSLAHQTPFQLLISTILSAQCTDARVNLVTPALFKRFPDAKAMSRATLPQIESLIRSTGFFHAKAKNIQAASRLLVSRFGGKVPSAMEDLILLPGVARKTANIVSYHAYGKRFGIAVDTHCIRLSRRLGFTNQTDQNKIERDLMALIPPADWGQYTNWMVSHGRAVCYAVKPNCA
ncbi:MAG: endonuclease III, partial [Candidatus Micrarchaeota archaeon]|nr:endonuclease III [Candidatus Micrarchaeota archaeon]